MKGRPRGKSALSKQVRTLRKGLPSESGKTDRAPKAREISLGKEPASAKALR